MNDSRHSRWHDLRTMLTDWLAWLDETQQWIEATTDTNRAEVCDPSVDAASDTTASIDVDSETPRPDLFALLATMTALRQEVNLQTRSARRDREQASHTLEQLSGLVTELEQERQDNAQHLAAQAADHVHVDVLLDLHDALSRAERQASHLIATATATLRAWGSQERLLKSQACDGPKDGASSEPADGVDAKTNTPGWWRRWFGRADVPDRTIETPAEHLSQAEADRAPEAVTLRSQVEEEARRMADRLDALTTGYGLSVQRLERMLMTCGIEPIPCLDKRVDPELMEVVQVVASDERAPGTVIDEVHRGYLRHNQLYRFAQVVATRSAPPSSLEPGHDAAPTDGTPSGDFC